MAGRYDYLALDPSAAPAAQQPAAPQVQPASADDLLALANPGQQPAPAPAAPTMLSVANAAIQNPPAPSGRRGRYDYLAGAQDAVASQGANYHATTIPDKTGTFLRTLASGVPLLGPAVNNYVAPAVTATLDPVLDAMSGQKGSVVPGVDPDWQTRFNIDRATGQGIDDQSALDQPVMTPVVRDAGALGSLAIGSRYLSPVTSVLGRVAPSAGLLPTMAANAADGSLLGGGLGYAGGSGGLTDPTRLSGAESGAFWGGAGGAVATPVIKGLGLLGRNTFGRLGKPIDIGASAAPSMAMSDAAPTGDVITPGALDAQAATIAPPLVSAKPSDLNRAYDLLYQAVNRGGQTPEQAISKVTSLGAPGILADANPAVTDFAKAVSRTPGQAMSIAKGALLPRQEGAMTDGQWTAPPSAARIAGQLGSSLQVSGPSAADRTAALLAQQASDAGPLYAKMESAPPVPISQFQKFAASNRLQKSYDAAREISQSEPVTLDDGTKGFAPLPDTMPDTLDWRSLNLMKQANDAQYHFGKSPLSGISATQNAAVKGYNDIFLDHLKSLNPDLQPALDAYSGPANAMDAIQAGRDYMSENPQAARASIAGLAPGDANLFRAGAHEAASDQITMPNGNTNAATKLGVNSFGKIEKLRALFPDDQSFGDFHNYLQGENQMTGTRNSILAGTTTSGDLAQQEDAGINPLDVVGAGVEAIHSPVTGLAKLANLAWRGGNSQGLREPVANAAAAILFHPNQAAFPEFLAGLTNAQKRVALQGVLSRGAPVAGAAGGVLGHPVAPQQPSGGVLGQ